MRDKLSQRRFFIFLSFLGVLILTLLIYLSIIMIFKQTDLNSTPRPLLAVERGLILDRNGEELAIQPELYSIEAWLPHLESQEETAQLLAKILGLDKSVILQKFEAKLNAVVIQHQLAPEQVKQIENLQKEGKLKGIYIKPKPGRIYPKKELACHVLGYVNVDNIGLSGIEYSFNDELSPPPSSNARKTYGNQVVLTIDIKLQYYLDKIALAAFQKYKPETLMLIVMDAKTAEILSYTSIPRFDPNEFSTYSDKERMNRPIILAYEPGSVMKIFSIASMLEKKAIRENDYFTCNGYYETKTAYGQTIRIKCMGEHGKVTAREIIKYSCNAGAASASDKIDNQSFYEMLRSFGFGKKTGILFAGESSGILNPPANWSARTKPTIAFGQEISVSAIQMVTAATALTNNGVLLKPQIVKRVISPDGKTVLRSFGREAVRQVISAETAHKILLMMEAVVERGGSAPQAQIKGMRIAAKTGTAQVIDPNTNRYSEKNYIASILGIFPIEDPQIILYVVLHNPQEGSYWGSRVAAPLFKEAAEEIIRYLDIPYEGETIFFHPNNIQLPYPPKITLGSVMPDLRGLPKRALYPLFEAGLPLILTGEGYVKNQEPAPGTKILKNTKIILYLE